MKSGQISVKEMEMSGNVATVWTLPIISGDGNNTTVEIVVALQTYNSDCELVFHFSSSGELTGHTFKTLNKEA